MDFARYPMLLFAYKVGKMGGIMPTVYNASNEEAVKLFLNGKISFLEIENIITEYVNFYQNIVESSKNTNITLDEILKVDKEVRLNIQKKYNGKEL